MGVTLDGSTFHGPTYAMHNVTIVETFAEVLTCRRHDRIFVVPLSAISEKSEVTVAGDRGTLLVRQEYADLRGWK